MRQPLPGRDVPVIDPQTGMMNQVWFDWFAAISALNIPAFSSTAPTNGQYLKYFSATGKYTPSA